jgi:ketohexokinase
MSGVGNREVIRVSRVLGVGIATLDLINEVAIYPAEDDEVRALGQQVRRGGNVTNSLAVLAELGHRCSWAGTLADDSASREILRALEGEGIDTRFRVRCAGGRTPTSCVTLSRATGSRTIVHHRDLPELAAADFTDIDLDSFDWVHFEGRNPSETELMLRDCSTRRPDLPVSLEVEKPRQGIDRLLVGPRVLIFSRAFVLSRGCTDPIRFLSDQWAKTGAELLVLPWGADGAYGQGRGGPVRFAPAHRPDHVADTLGAGDVFNAAVIDGLLAGLDLRALLERANRLAGHKCGRQGLGGLVASARRAGLVC